MKRRWFIGGAVGLAIGPGFSFAPRAVSAKVDGETILLADRFLQTCPKRLSAIEVGKAYLEVLPSLPKIGQLVDSLLDSLGTPSSQLKAMAPVDLRARLRARISGDFSAGRTVRLHGWILGDVEAQLCALAALCSGQKNSDQVESGRVHSSPLAARWGKSNL